MIQPLAWEPPYAVAVAQEIAKTKQNKTKQNKTKPPGPTPSSACAMQGPTSVYLPKLCPHPDLFLKNPVYPVSYHLNSLSADLFQNSKRKDAEQTERNEV